MNRAQWTLLIAALSGCASTNYQRKLEETEDLLASRNKELHAEKHMYEGAVAQLKADRESLQQALDDTDDALHRLVAERDELSKNVDEYVRLIEELENRLARTGHHVKQLTDEKSQLKHSLDDARFRLEQLQRQRQVAAGRAASFRHIVDRLRSSVVRGDRESPNE